MSEVKFFISEVNFSIYEVEKPDFEQNNRRESLCLGLSPLRYTKIILFSAKSKLLSHLNTLLKC